MLEALYADPMTEVFLFSYQYPLQSFANFSNYLQREEPLISRLHEQIQQFLKELPVNFSKLISLQMEICLRMYGGKRKSKIR